MKLNFKRVLALLIVALAALVFAAACGGGDPEDLTFDVTIRDNDWNVEGGIIRVKQGDHVTINVGSDVPGGFHLHGYDLYNEVAPGEPMSFEFTADATGNFEIQFHKFTVASNERAADADGHDDEAETELRLGSLQVFPR